MGFSPPVPAAERRVAFTPLHLPPGAAAVARLGLRCCRWPIGEPADEGFAFCGAPSFPGSSYCAVHARLARRRAPSRGGRA